MQMHRIIPLAAAAGLLAACSQGMAGSPAASAMPPAETSTMAMADSMPVTVGGQPMFATKDIVDNAVNSADHTTLVAAVKAAGLVQTLKGPGPFTVFAPVNAALFSGLSSICTVPGRLDYAAMQKLIEAGGGKATLTTVAGQPLTLMMNGPHNITVTDVKGNTAHITTYDVTQSNGDIQVIDTVLMPG